MAWDQQSPSHGTNVETMLERFVATDADGRGAPSAVLRHSRTPAFVAKPM
jgi:hypothetical protein